jgi:tetratricopeptide (TPR) repeat protein
MKESPDYESWFYEGMNFQDIGQYSQAVDCFQKAIDCQPNFIPAWVYKGIALEQLGEYEAAISCYEIAIKTHPKVADLWYNKGATLCNLHRYEEALICFDRVLEIDPYHAICQTARALTLATIPNPIKLPKRIYSESEIKPLETEASIALSLSEKKQIAGEISQSEELEPE